jgi:hypothetical protein
MTDPTDLSAPLERLVSRLARMVRHVGRGRGLADPDLDELLQEVRIRLWRARGGVIDPPPMPESKAHMKARAAAGKKIDQAKQRECSMQAANQAMGAVQGEKAAMEQKIADSRAAGITEAPGQTIELGNDPTAELKKGKTAARHIDWVAGSGDVSEAGKAPFQEAMTKLAASLRETGGGQYRIDLYMDQRYDETAVSMFGPPRMAEIQAALSSAGVSPAIVLMGKAKRDKNPRMELVKVK